VAAYTKHAPSLRIDAGMVTDPRGALTRALAFVEANRDTAPLVYSTADPAEVAAQQARHGAVPLAAAFDHFFASLAQNAIEAGFGRVIVAGGETASAVAGSIGSGAFEIGPEIAIGVPALRALGDRDVVLALKSGNFGGPDLFDRAVSVLRGGQ